MISFRARKTGARSLMSRRSCLSDSPSAVAVTSMLVHRLQLDPVKWSTYASTSAC